MSVNNNPALHMLNLYCRSLNIKSFFYIPLSCSSIHPPPPPMLQLHLSGSQTEKQVIYMWSPGSVWSTAWSTVTTLLLLTLIGVVGGCGCHWLQILAAHWDGASWQSDSVGWKRILFHWYVKALWRLCVLLHINGAESFLSLAIWEMVGCTWLTLCIIWV